jgi:uncharacterized membrane protein YraQ (UPF0718 family)
VLAVAAVGVHAFMDGAALGGTALGREGDGSMLALAVILHRLPEGLVIWWLLQPSRGSWLAAAALGLVAVGTAAGFFFGTSVLSATAARGLFLFQALVAGSLLHVVLHRPHPIVRAHQADRRHTAAGVGAIAGALLLVLLLRAHPSHDFERDARAAFVSLALAAAPALALAYVAAGLVHGLLPRASVAWMRRGSRLSQALRGLAFGVPLPVCTCGAVPLYRSLVLRGAPPAAALAFLVATPEIGFDSILLSLPLLGPRVAALRLVCALVVALVAAVIVARLVSVAERAALEPEQDRSPNERPWPARLASGLRFGLSEVVDETGPWILAGLAVAALAEPALRGDWARQVPRGLDVPLLALLGMPAYVCASGATPLAAVLVAKGVSPGACVAFLLTGPATNLTTFGVLARMHGRRVAIAFGVTVALLSVALGYAVNALAGPLPAPALFAPEAPAGALAWACLAFLALLLALSLLRKGPRAFVATVLSFGGHAHHEEHEAHPEARCDCGHVDHCLCHEHEHEHEQEREPARHQG